MANGAILDKEITYNEVYHFFSTFEVIDTFAKKGMECFYFLSIIVHRLLLESKLFIQIQLSLLSASTKKIIDQICHMPILNVIKNEFKCQKNYSKTHVEPHDCYVFLV